MGRAGSHPALVITGGVFCDVYRRIAQVCRGGIVNRYLNVRVASTSAKTKDFLQIRIKVMRQEESTLEQLDVGKKLHPTHSRGVAEFGKCKEREMWARPDESLLLLSFLLL